jgi:hypothetical protein
MDFRHFSAGEPTPQSDDSFDECLAGIGQFAEGASSHESAFSDYDYPENIGEGLTGRGTFLDPTIFLGKSHGLALVEAVIDLLAAHRRFRRARQEREVRNELELVNCLLANGLSCLWHRNPPIVSYQRKADAKRYVSKFKPDWLSAQAVGRAVKLLESAGLVQSQKGNAWRETSSAYVVAPGLLKLADEHCVSDQSLLRRLHREDLVQLKGPKPPPVFDPWTRTLVRPRAERIPFQPTMETEEWRDCLAAYNEFVAGSDIRVDPPSEVIDQWVLELNDDETRVGARFSRPEYFRTALYRVFNDGQIDDPEFNHGGRLVGAWWVNASKDARPYILIDGRPTVELDFDACHPRMLYHELGLEPSFDLYKISEITRLELELGLEPGFYRGGIKWLTQILINGRRPQQVPPPPDIQLPDKHTIPEMLKIIERHHKPIASAFRTGAGLRLMKAESDIALNVTIKAMQRGALVLPVHDSFVAKEDFRQQLKQLMEEEYQSRMGRKPVIT